MDYVKGLQRAVDYKVELHNSNDDENKVSLPDFWTRSRRDGTLKYLADSSCGGEFIFGICYDGADDNSESFEYSIAAAVADDFIAPEGFRVNTVPARTWAVFECVGAMPDAMQNALRKIFSEFFPTSGYTPTYEMDVEAYGLGDMSSPDYRSEIWVPIKK